MRTLLAPANAFALVALLLGAALSGCLAPAPSRDAGLARAVAEIPPMTWSRGNWWAFHAIFQEEQSVDVALVVHEPVGDGFRLGSNVSAGFFGLPFHGNLTRDLNPVVGGDEWPLFRFPLEDGKTWTYRLFGYDAKAVARAALVEVPGVGPRPGYWLEASSYGQVFARYAYAPEVGWLTRLELTDPATGERVLDVALTAFGPRYGEGYYVERPVREVRIQYPALPGALRVDVPEGYERVEAVLTVRAEGGLVEARVADGRGHDVASARAAPRGIDVVRFGAEGGASAWTLDHRGAGKGVVLLEVVGLVPVGQPAPSAQSTRPAVPQLGHLTSTGLPVGW